MLLEAIWVAYYKTACHSLKTGVSYKDSSLIQLSLYKRKKGDGKKERMRERTMREKEEDKDKRKYVILPLTLEPNIEELRV